MKILPEHWPNVISYVDNIEDVGSIYSIEELRSYICGNVWIDHPDSIDSDLSYSIGKAIDYPERPTLGTSLHHSMTFSHHHNLHNHNLRNFNTIFNSGNRITQRDYFNEYASAAERLEEDLAELTYSARINSIQSVLETLTEEDDFDMEFIGNDGHFEGDLEFLHESTDDMSFMSPRNFSEFKIPERLKRYLGSNPIVVIHIPHYMSHFSNEVKGIIKFMLKKQSKTYFRISIQGTLSRSDRDRNLLAAPQQMHGFGRFFGFDFPDVTVLDSSIEIYPQKVYVDYIGRFNYNFENLKEVCLDVGLYKLNTMNLVLINAPNLEMMKIRLRKNCDEKFNALFEGYRAPNLKEIEIVSDDDEIFQEHEKVSVDLYTLLKRYSSLKIFYINSSLIRLDKHKNGSNISKLKTLHLENITTPILLEVAIMKSVETVVFKNLPELQMVSRLLNWGDNLKHLTIINCECLKSIVAIFLPELRTLKLEYTQGTSDYELVFWEDFRFPNLLSMDISIDCYSTIIRQIRAPLLKRLSYNVKTQKTQDMNGLLPIFSQD